MWWLLGWFGVLLGLGTTGTVASYVAVTRFGVLEIIAANVLRRGLKGLSLQNTAQEAYKVTRIQGGIRVENLQLAKSVMDTLAIFFLEVEAASVAFLQVQFPTWVAPFRLRIRGLRIAVRQRNMPLHVNAGKLAEQELETSRELKAAKLQAIDRLLWGTEPNKATAADGTYGSRLRARILHRAMAFCVEFIEVDAEDVSCSYSQEREPGPLPNPRSHMEGRDSTELSIRRLLLSPQQQRPAIPRHMAGLEDMVNAPGEQEQDLQSGLPGFLRMFRIPSILWRHVTLNQPRSTRAVIAGVIISLSAFGTREPPRPGQSATEPVPVSATAPAPEQPFAFTAGVQSAEEHGGSAGGHVRSRLGSQEGAPPSSVRRKRFRAGAQDRQQGSPDVQQGAGPAAPGSPQVPAQPAQPSERHIVLRQWGADVTVAVLPPVYHQHNTATAEPLQPLRSTALETMASTHALDHVPVATPFANGEHAGPPNGVSNHMEAPKPPDAAERQASTQLRKPLAGVDSWTLARARSHEQEDPPAGFVCTVDVDVNLRAFVPHLTPQSVAVAFRMLDRAQQYSQYSPYWQSRPSVPVSRSPSCWWQHAGSAAARECKLISRRQVPLVALAARRLRRLQYQELYARTHSRLSSFTEPRRHWWQRRQTPKAGSEETALLASLEEQLSLEESSHFRAGVAALHSSALLGDPDHLRHALDAVDAVVGNLGPLPAPMAAMLFQSEAQAGGPAPALALNAAASCPRIGLQLSVEGDRNPLTAPLPDTDFTGLEAVISNVSCQFGVTGVMRLTVESIGLSGQQSVDNSRKEHLLKSPSIAANRMLQVADLHGVVSKARGFNAELKSGADNFLCLRLSSEPGRAQHPPPPKRRKAEKASAADIKPAYAAVLSSSSSMEIRPPGMRMDIELAGIEIEYNKHIVRTVLNFAKHLAQLKDRPLQSQAPASQQQLPELKAAPGQPATLSERVFHAFAQQNMPVYKPLSLPVNHCKLSCPGIAARVPYTHCHAIGCQEQVSQQHELIAAVTRIRTELSGEDFREFMRKGATQRSTVHAYLDLFCYQQPAYRRRSGDDPGGMTRATAFGNRTISGQRREEREVPAVDPADDSEARDSQEMAAMAKVWAHPEDLHKYPLASARRSTRGSFSGTPLPSLRAGTGRPRRIPAFPMIPLLKVAGLQSETAQKVLSLPAAPGSLAVNTAASLHGIMVWLSPWQVAHLLSILDTVKRDLLAAMPALSSGSPAGADQKAGASAMRTQLRVQASLEIPLISAICSVARSQAELEAAIQRPRTPQPKSQWTHQIPESDPAYLWAMCLAPTYGVNILGSRAALSFRGTGHLRGGLTIDGLLVRDLQLQPKSRFAYFLRPLPARTGELTLHATKFRTRMLRVVSTSAAARRWYWAVRKVILKRRSSLSAERMESRLQLRKAALPFTSFVGMKTVGPQLVACCYLPPAEKYPGHPEYRPAPPARLQIQVGQLLLYARVSSNNRMLPFCSQIIDLVQDMSRISPSAAATTMEGPAPVAKTEPQQPAHPQQCGASFAGILLDVGVVGVDLKVVVQGRELVSLQLLDATMALALAPDPPPPQESTSVSLGLRIVDISIRDLQAIREHSMVLRPNKRAEHCSLALDYSMPISPQVAPLLVIEVANPRVLALFRFVYDIIHGVDIINSAFATNGGIFPGASSTRTSQQAAAPGLAPEVLVHLTHAGIVLPASSKSLKVLVGDVDYIMLAMPGSGMSDSALNAAGLPSVRGMLKASRKATRLFNPQQACSPPEHAREASPFVAPEVQSPARGLLKRPMTAHSAAREQGSRHGSNLAQPHPGGGLGDDLVRGWDDFKRQTGVLFLNRSLRAEPLPSGKRGVINVAVDDTAAAPQPGPAPGVIWQRRGGSSGAPANTPGRQREDRATSGGPPPVHRAAEASRSLCGPDDARPPEAMQRGMEAPLPGSAPSDDDEASDLPEPQIAVFAEGLVVSRASLKSLMKDKREEENTFCPKSVFHFAWPVLDFVTVDRAPFLQPSSYSIVLYDQRCAATQAGSYLHLHLAAAPVVLILNAPNYAALLGFAQGNLLELSSYASTQGPHEDREPLNTKFNPAFQFGPPRDDMPTFRMTAGLPLVTTVFEADPQHWQSGTIRSRMGDPSSLARLPFMRARVQNIEMDLGVLEKSGATYMQFNAGGAACDDLRLAYSKIMTEYEIYSEDAVSDLPQSRMQSHAAYPGEKDDLNPRADPDDVAAEAAAELRASQPQGSSMRPRSASEAPRGRRERSGDILRLKSLQMHREQQVQMQQLQQTTRASQGWRSDSLQGSPRAVLPSPGTAPIPVVSMELVSSLEAYFPAGSPVVHLLKAPAAFPAAEAAHLGGRGHFEEGSEVVGATIALFTDGTVAVEVSLSLALIQWPFLTDISLAWAAASIFDPLSAEPGTDPSAAAATTAAESILRNSELAPWLYFNCILRDSQLFVPVADPETLRDGVNFYFGGGAAAMNLHERLADLLLMELAFSMEEPEYALRVEERGLSITWSALRVSCAQGGDGESDVRGDLRHFAAFVRDPCAIVTCILLPFSCSLHLEMQVPHAQEREAAKREQRAVVLIQRAWRRRRWQRTAECSRGKQSRSGRSGDRSSSAAQRPVLRVRDAVKLAAKQAGQPLSGVSQVQMQTSASIMEQLIQEVASPRTHTILRDYYQQTEAMGGVFQHKREPASMHMRLTLGACTVRAAFSHVPFIQSVLWIMRTVILQPSPGNLTADSSLTATQSAMEKEAAAREFRPSAFHMDGSMQTVSLVLCNDKPQTFGAPDVLRLSLDQLAVKYMMDMRFHDRPPDQVAEVAMQFHAQFLNNSSSRWESICENWQLQAELVDTVSPIYRSDFQRHLWLTSKQHLGVHFNPAGLLSFGDALAFANAVQGPMPNYDAVAGAVGSGDGSRLAASEAAPEMQEQMAQRGSITSRVPQKYLIQNQSGLRVYYWAGPEHKGAGRGPVRTHSLDTGVSETLKVTPQRKVLQHVTPGRGGIGKLQNVIKLHFEGNWMPIKDVAVSVVGKYRYHMHSPAEHDRAPVVVDIILVGRTKIITLHSGIWLENCMDRKVSFRLHVPLSPLVAPSRRLDARQQNSDTTIGPLRPGAGMYLPVTAVLGGLLFVRPSGFKEAKRDVIRLSPVISEIEAQQGHITCDSMSVTTGGPAIQVNSEFQAFKHIEMLAPGEFMRATESLEATLAIHPTLVLTNALPYVMEVIVWQVAPFRKLRQEKTRGRRAKMTEHLYYDFRQMQTAFTGTVPIIGEANPYSDMGVEDGSERAPSDRADLSRGSMDLRRRASLNAGNESADPGKGPRPKLGRPSRLLSALSPHTTPTTAGKSTRPADSSTDSDESEEKGEPSRLPGQEFRPTHRANLVGEHIAITLAPGVSQNVYADMGGNVLVHIAIPALGMVATHWAVVSWSKDQVARESYFDAKYVYRLPKEIKLRNLDSKSSRNRQAASGVAEYISRLKSAGQRFRDAAHLHRKQKVEFEATAADQEAQRPAHQKLPSDGTPIGPSVPTAMPSHDLVGDPGAGEPGTPQQAMEGPSDPRWYNALYGSRTPSPGSEPAEKAGTPVNMQPGSSTGLLDQHPEHSTTTVQASRSPTELPDSPWSGLQPTSSFANGGLQDHASSGGGATAEPQTALTKSASKPNGLPSLRTLQQTAQAEAVPVEMANGVPEIQPAGPLPEPAGNELGSGPVRGERLQGEHASPGDRRGSAADTEEDKLRSLGRMRWAFEAWREYAVCKATGHTGLLRQVTEPGVFAPDVLVLNIQNSLAHSSEKRVDNPICLLSFFSPYWVDNRTNMDLILQDHLSASPNPLLLGYQTPLDYGEVSAPGVGLIEPDTPGGTHRSFWDIDNHKEIAVQPTLLNKQDTTRFCLADVARKQFSGAIHINTVGLKGSMRVRGPVPSQSMHLAKAVQDGVRRAMRRPSAGPETGADGRPTEPGTVQGGVLTFQSDPLPAEPIVEDRVKVSIVPLVTVDIQELVPRDSGEDAEQAAVFIKPRRPASSQQLVSLVLEVTRERAAHATGAHRRLSTTDEGVNLDAILLSQDDEEDHHGAVEDRLRDGKDSLTQALHLQRSHQASSYKVGQREFEFVSEVTSAPPSSVFRRTKVLTIKPRFVVDNQTGMAIEVKQRGTPDLSADPFYGDHRRCSCRLDTSQRAAFHWDNTELDKVLVVRPLGDALHGGECEWQWSGGFNLGTREEYFGLRIRHKTIHSRAINIPVNSTVGPSGCVLVTFKSRFSVPPYRIENRTTDVVVYFAQSSLKATRENWNWLAPRPGGSAMAYAWDEPTADHRLQVQAHVQNRVGRPFAATYELDKLGSKAPLNLPSATKTFSGNSTLERVRTLQRDSNVPNSLKERVASVLASEFSKKVYVTVFADGPTRVLRFSDEPSAVTVEAEQSILDLAARLKQVEAELAAVNGKFLQLHGPAGGAQLDLYGRAAMQPVAPPDAGASKASSFRDGKSASQSARIRLRQRGVIPIEGSPLSMSRAASAQVESPARPEIEMLSKLPSSRRSRMPDRAVSVQEGQAGKAKALADGKMDVIRPQDLGHHLANLHVPASSQAVQGSELMQSSTAADSALLLGGDLLVTVWEAEGLQGNERVTHPFARLRIGEQSQLTSVQWQSLTPRWDEALNFRDVSAASELQLELWDIGGTRGAKQLQKLSQDPSKVIASARFLGSVEVPLTNSMAMSRGSKHRFALMRRSAADRVSGSVKLSFAWDVTARSLLNLKLAALERVLAQRTEVLCMLNPTTADAALRWAREDAQQGLLHPPEAKDKPDDVERSDPSTTRSEERSLAERLLAKHMHEEHHSTLNVSVIEARGLGPRSGVVVAFQANQLPNPVVEVSVPGHPSHSVAARHTVNPRWDDSQPASYKRLSSDSHVTVRMLDRKGRSHMTLLGENTISCSRLTGDKPMYIWLPLLPSVKARSLGGLRKRRKMPSLDAEVSETPELQVHLRLQWVRQVVRGQYMNAEVSLLGLGLIVMGGLQDELFNLTVDRIKLSTERSHLEARFRGSIKRIQLDNQMLDATQPVVLAPASVAHAHSKTAQALTGQDTALIEFGVARSFANSVLGGNRQGSQAAPAGNREQGLVGAMGRELQEGEKLGEGSSSIMSFKEIWITIGELDFQADDGFLEAILSFVVSIPMADVWQDDAWREQQRRLLTAQFGPKEVESLSMNAVLPIDVDARRSAAPLEWMQTKELYELQVLRDQSSYSSWYFIERAYIGEINANVTIALTSSVLNARSAAAPLENAGGLFSRFIGASGFQLINVNNVPLSLGSWSVDTKLLGRKAMVNSLARHYFAQSIAEAHKVLGGAGPAIAAVPLTVVWVGGSFVTLLTGISAGKVGPVGAAQRIGYVFFMSVAQVVSSLSRIGLSLMTFAPPNRTGHFSDSRALTRAVQRPANAFEAFGRCWGELFDSFIAALVGVLLDPTQGYHTGGLPMAMAGLVKGTLGVVVRPTVGVLELVSKGTHGMGLVCLGREAITGSAQRRVRAPGALVEEQTEAVDDARIPEMQAAQRSVVAAWQSSLPHMFPQMKGDTVLEVIDTHASRTLLLCKGHVALIRSKSLALRSTYKSMWAVPISEIKIVRGEDDKLRINLEHASKYDTKCLGVWTIPRRKIIKCGSRDLLDRIIVRVNRHMSSVNAGTEQAFSNKFDTFRTADLSIYNAPYSAAPSGP